MMDDEVHNERPNLLLAILVALFGSTAWIGPDSFLVEQSIHIQRLPEGWSLGATTTIVVQISALVALTYTILESMKFRIKQTPLIMIALAVNLCAFIPLGYFNEISIEIAGKPRSVVLYGAMFFMGAVAILSDVLFFPYMKNLPQVYFQAYFFGVGLSAFVPSILSIVQDSDTYECVPIHPNSTELEPRFNHIRFGVETYYTIIFSWCFLGSLAFLLIHFHRDAIDELWYGRMFLERTSTKENVMMFKKTDKVVDRLWAGSDYILLFLLTILTALVYVVIPSIQSFVALPYSSKTYFWSLTLGSIMQPISAFLAHIFPTKSIKYMILQSIITIVACCFCFLLALNSPSPWLAGTTKGSALVLFLTSSVYGVGYYSRCAIFEAIRDKSPSEAAMHRRLLYVGFTSQVGAALGTLFVFPAVNIFELFKSVPPC